MADSTFEKLFAFWAQQLHHEFEDICWQYSIRLQAPIIEISRSNTNYGSWKAGTRTLCISSYLITNYSWAVTQNVFKHEIAHQICSEIFHSRETAHGKDFEKACELLGLPEGYRGAGCDLPEHLSLLTKETVFTSGGRKFITKVEKLLALARSANEHEATLAMQKANELVDKYNLACLAAGNESCYYHVIINNKKKQIPSYQRRICSILIEFFYVKVVTSSLYDPHTDQSHKTIEVFGTQENVTLAEYCYHFLENRLAFLWKQNRHKYTGKVRTERTSYYLGVLNGFHKQLSRRRGVASEKKVNSDPAKITDLKALLRVEDTKLDAYVQMRFPRLRKISRRGLKIYPTTYDEGVESGKALKLSKGISVNDGNRGRLIA